MGALFQIIIRFLGSLFGKWFTAEVAKFMAFRAFLITLFYVILPVVLFKSFSLILQFWISYVQQQLNSANFSLTLQLAGLGGWMALHLKIPECLSILFSALSFHFTLRMLRV